MESKASNPIVRWVFNEQAGISSKDLAEIVGITQQHLSRAKHGKQDLGSDFLWRLMVAIAKLRPHSDCAEFVRLVEKGRLFPSQSQTLSSVVAAADESELEMVMLQIVARLFPKSRVSTDIIVEAQRVKSPVLS
jgi:transcriptional regulator with XRE-family HTH domain